MSKITAAYVHVRKSKEDFGVIGIAVTKSKDTNWYLFKNDDQNRKNIRSWPKNGEVNAKHHVSTETFWFKVIPSNCI